MTYTPKEWETGDIIGASDLNNLEEGVGTAIAKTIVVIGTVEESGGYTNITLNKTLKQIADLIKTGFVVISVDFAEFPNTTAYSQFFVVSVNNNSEEHQILAFLANEPYTFICASEDDYPVATLS